MQCKATYRSLNKLQLAYSIDEDGGSADSLLAKNLGYMQAPIVLVRDLLTGDLLDSWSGFRPDKIDEWAPHIPRTTMAA